MWTLNRIANACGKVIFAVLGHLPGWASLTVLSAVTGVLALLAFKYTSNQRMIGQVRDRISANLLAVKLFKDNVGVTLKCQGRLLVAAGHLMLLSLVPLAVMIVPMALLIAQMAMYYEFRPLHPGETTELIAELAAGTDLAALPVAVDVPAGVVVEAGPTRVNRPPTGDHAGRAAVAWRIRADQPGRHRLMVHCGAESTSKEVVVATGGHQRVSPVRPGASWQDQLLYPVEPPASPAAIVQRITLDDQPAGSTPFFGWDLHWLVSFLVLSMVAALLFKPLLKVRL